VLFGALLFKHQALSTPPRSPFPPFATGEDLLLRPSSPFALLQNCTNPKLSLRVWHFARAMGRYWNQPTWLRHRYSISYKTTDTVSNPYSANMESLLIHCESIISILLPLHMKFSVGLSLCHTAHKHCIQGVLQSRIVTRLTRTCRKIHCCAFEKRI